MQTARTTTPEGVATEFVDTTPKVTAQFEYSHTSFGNGPKAAVTAQVVLPVDASEDVIAEETKIALQNCRARVFEALGFEYSVDGDGVVIPVIPEIAEKPKAASKPRAASGGSRPSTKGATKKAYSGDIDARVTEAWADLQFNEDSWFNNVNDKSSDRSPDFKGKRGTEFDGLGLWLDDNKNRTPAWALEKYGQ